MVSAFINSLPQDTKTWFARAVVGMITADRKIERGELLYLKEIVMFLGDDEEIKKIIEMVKKTEQPELTTLKTDRTTATRIFFELATLAVTDEKLSRSEADYFIRVGNKLGFDKFFSRRVLDWGKKYCAVDKEKKVLMKHGEDASVLYT